MLTHKDKQFLRELSDLLDRHDRSIELCDGLSPDRNIEIEGQMGYHSIGPVVSADVLRDFIKTKEESFNQTMSNLISRTFKRDLVECPICHEMVEDDLAG